MGFFKAAFDKIKGLIKNQFRNPDQSWLSLNSVTHLPFKIITKGTRQQKRIEWCKDFNRRNGYVVSEKSPISIYFKAGGR